MVKDTVTNTRVIETGKPEKLQWWVIKMKGWHRPMFVPNYREVSGHKYIVLLQFVFLKWCLIIDLSPKVLTAEDILDRLIENSRHKPGGPPNFHTGGVVGTEAGVPYPKATILPNSGNMHDSEVDAARRRLAEGLKTGAAGIMANDEWDKLYGKTEHEAGLNHRLGMYGETASVTVGKYTISQMTDKEGETRIWIQTDDGGEFEGKLLEPYITEFYNKHF